MSDDILDYQFKMKSPVCYTICKVTRLVGLTICWVAFWVGIFEGYEYLFKEMF